MRIWTRMASGLSRALSILGLVLLLAISLGITVEVVLRKLFSMTLGGIDELSSYGFAVFTSFAFSVAALSRANIRIVILRALFPAGGRVAFDLLSQCALLGFTAFLSWRAYIMVSTSWAKGTRAITPLATPVAWPQTLWLVGLIIFLSVLTAMLVLAIFALLQKDDKGFKQLAGPTSELDEIEDLPRPDRSAATGGLRC